MPIEGFPDRSGFDTVALAPGSTRLHSGPLGQRARLASLAPRDGAARSSQRRVARCSGRPGIKACASSA
eukprot:15468566-Alexandrium_andersonii.AAC.1